MKETWEIIQQILCPKNMFKLIKIKFIFTVSVSTQGILVLFMLAYNRVPQSPRTEYNKGLFMWG